MLRSLRLSLLPLRLTIASSQVGQALSIRADLLSPPYIAALTGLQDRVPPFSNDEARAILAREWGLPNSAAVDSLFGSSGLSSLVAAASLGQVYRGVLKEGGREVAVKVQRPGVEDGIALDLLLIRAIMATFKRVSGANTDLIGLVDDWGRGFVDELDYELEASNAEEFVSSIADSPLAGVVTAPTVDRKLSTKRVLVTGWVDGERLERSQADDVASSAGWRSTRTSRCSSPRACSTATLTPGICYARATAGFASSIGGWSRRCVRICSSPSSSTWLISSLRTMPPCLPT